MEQREDKVMMEFIFFLNVAFLVILLELFFLLFGKRFAIK